jgi:hypothetical protein
VSPLAFQQELIMEKKVAGLLKQRLRRAAGFWDGPFSSCWS